MSGSTVCSGASLVAQLVKNPPAMQETLVQILGAGRSTGEGIGYPLQYSGLENSTGCIVHGVAKSQMQLSDFHFQEKRNLTVFLTDSVHRHHGCCRVKTTKELEAWAN